jgi:hypothetical protein
MSALGQNRPLNSLAAQWLLSARSGNLMSLDIVAFPGLNRADQITS